MFRRIRKLRIGKHTILVVVDSHARAGCFYPVLHLHLNGPNGSVAGTGPKGWPTFLADRLGAHYHRKGQWSNMLEITLPHIPWHRAAKLRRIGGFRLYNAQYRAYRRLVSKPDHKSTRINEEG